MLQHQLEEPQYGRQVMVDERTRSLGPEYELDRTIDPRDVSISHFHTQHLYGGQVVFVGEEAMAQQEMGSTVGAITVRDMPEWNGMIPHSPIVGVPGAEGFYEKEAIYPHYVQAGEQALRQVLEQQRQSGAEHIVLRAHHADGTLVAYRVQKLLAQMGIPSHLIATIHALAAEKVAGTPPNEIDPIRNIINKREHVEKAMYRKTAANGGLVTTSPLALRFLERYGISPDSVHIIPPGIDHNVFSPEGNEDEDWAMIQAHLGVQPGQRFIYSAGRMSRQKGHHVAIRAFGEIAQEHPDMVLAISGGKDTVKDEAYRAHLREVAAQAGVADRVILNHAIPQPAVAAGYRRATLATCLSEYENFNLMIAEAAVCGARMISGDTMGATHSALQHHPETLVAVDPFNHEAVANAMRRVIGDPDLQARMAQQGVRWTQDLSWQNMALRYHDIATAMIRRRTLQQN